MYTLLDWIGIAAACTFVILRAVGSVSQCMSANVKNCRQTRQTVGEQHCWGGQSGAGAILTYLPNSGSGAILAYQTIHTDAYIPFRYQLRLPLQR